MSKKKSAKQDIKKIQKSRETQLNNEILSDRSRILFWGSLLAVIILGVLLYSNTLHVPFYFDDYDSIIDNPQIKNLQNFDKLPGIFNFNDRYLSYLSVALNFHFGGMNVVGYHIVNIVIHLINSILVMLLTQLTLNTPTIKNRYNPKEKKYFILLVGLLFISHPIQTQAVTYIIQRMTSLAALFYLSTLLLYVKARLIFLNDSVKTKNKYFIAALLFVLSLLTFIMGLQSKQIVASLPISLIIYEIIFLRNKENKINWNMMISILVPFLIIAGFVIAYFGIPIEADEISRKDYLITQINVLVAYLKLLFIPVNQNIDYDFPLATTLADIGTIINLSLLVALLIISIKFAKKYPLISFSILWFFVTLSVESSIIPIRDVIVEHRLYLPVWGFSLLLVSIIFSLMQKYGTITILFFTCLVLTYSILTYQRNSLWNDPISMWTDAINKSPTKVRPYFARGAVYLHNNEIDLSIIDMKKVVELDKNFFKAYDNLGVAYQEKKDYETALQYHAKAISINPSWANAYNNRASALILLGKYDQSINDLNKALSLNPNYPDALYNLGYIFYKTSKFENSIKYFSEALALNPTYMDIHQFLAKCYLELEKYEKAWEQIKNMQKKGIVPNTKLVEKLSQVSKR